MASNSLRVIYDNLADSSTIVASTTRGTTSANNLKLEKKSKVWQSTGTTATLTVTFAVPSVVGGVVLPFTNFTSAATIRVQGYNGATQEFDTGSMQACPYQQFGLWDWGNQPLGVNAYTYGGGTYARAYFTKTSVSSLVITLTDTYNSNGYLECSRLVVGNYWTPTYNTEYGLSQKVIDTSSSTRTESGDLVSNRGNIFTSLQFNLSWLTAGDRQYLVSILKSCGTFKPIFISLFPEDLDPSKEQNHQIYGKLKDLAPISHPVYTMYSSQIDIEEV